VAYIVQSYKLLLDPRSTREGYS